MKVKNGDVVRVEYTGSLEDGTVFDSSKTTGSPLIFEVGGHEVVPGFEKAMLGMKNGEEKNMTLKPEEAYGNPDPSLKKKIPRDKLPKEPEPKEGMLVALTSPDGNYIPARIDMVAKTEVTLDLNHPLAGKTLKFKVKIVGVNEDEDIERGKSCDFGHEDSCCEVKEEEKPKPAKSKKTAAKTKSGKKK